MNTLRAYETKVFNKINPLVNFSVTRYVLAVGIFVAVAIFGIVSTRGLGVDLLPNIVIPAVVVRTSYPGETPSVMDLQVTQVLENVVSTVSGITESTPPAPAAFYLSERKRVDQTSAAFVPFENMQLGKNLEALEVPMRLGVNTSTIYPVLMWDKKDGATLIDTGVPGSDQAIGEHLARLGLEWKDVRRIIITHQDIDHIGGASAAVKASNAEVLAHGDDIPYIQGDRRLLKMDPNRIETMLQAVPAEQRERVRQLFTNPPKVHVNRALVDGETLPYGGGIVVIHTPGHTPGHISLFLTADRILISGDALRAENGVLQGPSPTATPDLPLATASLRKLLDYPIDRVLCYHGGLTKPGALARLKELVGSA